MGGVRARVMLIGCLLALACAPSAAAAPDCDGPPAAAQPGTPEWDQREADNESCGSQRSNDTAANPAYSAAAAAAGPVAQDPFRDPAALNGHRFRWERVSFDGGSGAKLDGMLFRPLSGFAPPYPGVLVVHGGSATQEMYLWGAEALAEAGYMVLTFQVPQAENTGGADAHYRYSKAALDYLFSDSNPHWTELDREHVGLAGHSAGGVAVSRLGQEDPRVGAIVSWDRAQSSPMPDGLKLRTPALFLTADFNCQKVPVCLPERYSSPPDPRGPGNKDEDFQRVSAAGVDSMKVSLRAATHLDFTQFAPTPPSSRYGALVASYYTLAWFDRYLRSDRGALARLTGSVFDASADVHYISGGTFDPASGANVPARIAGRPVADRLSFHFRSAWSFRGGRARCEDIRAGCPTVSAGAPQRCLHPRFAPRTARVRHGRVRVRPRVRCLRRTRHVVVRLRAGGRLAHVVSGRAVSVPVGRRVRRMRATFTVDGRRHRASVLLRRRGSGVAFAG
jgi:dienelactone hydrolase